MSKTSQGLSDRTVARVFFVSLLMVLLPMPQAVAAGFCVTPVEGGEPLIAVEKEDPYRMATRPKTLPGFSGLLVSAFNRPDILEFDGQTMRPIATDFPHTLGFVYELGVHIGPDGGGYGFGHDPRVIFYIGPEDTAWRPLENTRGYARAFYDQGSGEAYVVLNEGEQPALFVDGAMVEREPLPVFREAPTQSVVTVPDLPMKLALTGHEGGIPHSANAIWFKRPGSPWKPIRTSLPEGAKMITSFGDAKIHVEGDIVRIFPKLTASAPLFLRRTKEGLRYAGSAPAGRWLYHADSKSWIGWIGKWSYPVPRKRFLWFGAEEEPQTPLPFVVRPGAVQAELIPDVIPPVTLRGDTNFYHPVTIIPERGGPALLSSVDGFVAFDGVGVTALDGLRYENVGVLPQVLWLDGRHFVQSQKGVFALNDDLTVTRNAAFPVAQPWAFQTHIDYNPLWRQFVVVDRTSGAVFTSPDLRRFSTVEAPVRITKFVAFTPDRTAALLVGEDRLYALGSGCE